MIEVVALSDALPGQARHFVVKHKVTVCNRKKPLAAKRSGFLGQFYSFSRCSGHEQRI